MSKKGIWKMMANFTFIEDGKKLILNANTLADVEEAKRELEQTNPKVKYVIKDHSFASIGKASIYGKVKQIEEIAGFSLWEILPQK